MARPPGARARAWGLLLGAALLADALAIGYLAFVIRGIPREPSPISEGPQQPAATAPLPPTYFGNLPPYVVSRLPANLRPAASAAEADLLIEPSGDGVPVRWFVPVTAWGTGVDEMTLAALRDFASGAVSDWSEVGGLPGAPRFSAAEADAPLVTAWLGGQPERFPDYDALLDASTFGSGRWALVPVDSLRPTVVPLRVDGQDPWTPGAAASWPFVERWEVRPLTPRGEALAERVKESIAAEPPSAIRIVATGDILQTRCTLARIEALGDWRAPLATPLGEFLAGADLTIGSLDTSIQDLAEPFRCVDTTNLTAPPKTTEALVAAGFDVLSVATNHTFDCGTAGACGPDAFLRTLELLEAAGIRPVGGGRNLEEALAPVVIDVKGVRVAILAFDDIAAGPPNENAATETTPGTAPMDDSYEEERPLGYPAFYAPAELLGVERLRERVKAAKEIADVVIVLLQSGTEDTHDPSPRSIKAARAAVEGGADLVVGNQAHWVQAIEPLPHAFITYALGNFIFDQVHTIEHQQGVLLEAFVVDRRLAGVRLHPYRIMEQYRPEFVDDGERRKILADIFAATARLLEQGEGRGT